MDLNNFKLFKALGARMQWLQGRQRVLAENVANADTPNFKAMDLRPMSFKNTLSMTSTGMQMKRTQAGHIGAGSDGAVDVKITTDSQHFSANATGNTVVLEEEMMKSAQTAADYQLATNIYKKSVGLFRLAIS
jgi:flagellar basal-body rod protein FlgB